MLLSEVRRAVGGFVCCGEGVQRVDGGIVGVFVAEGGAAAGSGALRRAGHCAGGGGARGGVHAAAWRGGHLGELCACGTSVEGRAEVAAGRETAVLESGCAGWAAILACGGFVSSEGVCGGRAACILHCDGSRVGGLSGGGRGKFRGSVWACGGRVFSVVNEIDGFACLCLIVSCVTTGRTAASGQRPVQERLHTRPLLSAILNQLTILYTNLEYNICEDDAAMAFCVGDIIISSSLRVTSKVGLAQCRSIRRRVCLMHKPYQTEPHTNASRLGHLFL